MNFHRNTVHLVIIKVLFQTDAQENTLKGILTFTLKILQHVSV